MFYFGGLFQDNLLFLMMILYYENKNDKPLNGTFNAVNHVIVIINNYGIYCTPDLQHYYNNLSKLYVPSHDKTQFYYDLSKRT